MKIEKLNDNQIRCTLKKSDLASRHLKISELAYGSEKAKELFRDIMKQASYEFGFEADDIPLMIEAIPVSADCIVLIVTKVEDPEELDTRFSKFSPIDSEEDDFYPYDDDFGTLSTIDDSSDNSSGNLTASDELDIPSDDVAKDVMNLFNKVRDLIGKGIEESFSVDTPEGDFTVMPNKNSSDNDLDSDTRKSTAKTIRIFSFDNFDTVSEAAASAILVYSDRNSLYKSTKNSKYYLVLEKNACSSIAFNKVCNILSEYGTKEYASISRLNFFKEHYECICPNRAIQVIAKL